MRWLSAIGIGLVFGAWNFWIRSSGHYTFSDFDQIWYAARALRAGADPYVEVPRYIQFPFYYPLPAALLALPFSVLPLGYAAALWVAAGFGALAYALASRGAWALLLLAGPPALSAANLAQWTPILTASAIVPAIGWIGIGKPTTAFAVSVSRGVSRSAVLVGLTIVAVSFGLRPSWVGEWIAGVREAAHFTPLVFRPLGFVMLLAALRWRTPEGRLLLGLALVPATLGAYDALPLVLIPRSKREIAVFSLCAAMAGILAQRIPEGLTFTVWAASVAQVYFVGLFIPCLLMVLGRPRAAPTTKVD